MMLCHKPETNEIKEFNYESDAENLLYKDATWVYRDNPHCKYLY